ncbi:MAG: transcriptional regulator GcvA [Pseudomonadota bacterium]|jgi:LysR family glycine cleavage system transcriptional activator|nr:transcriptional regulator GcvA [Pseudomonadota bacterium]
MHAPPSPDRRRLPPLNALRAFEAAARHESFHAAADELAVTPGAIAQHVKALEAWLRLPLFRRLPSRGVVLTQAGQRYVASISRLLDELAEATQRLVAQDNAHVLTVSTIPSLAAQWLIPRLGAFRAQNPGLDVRVVASNGLTDFAREEVDLAIRYGRGGYPGLVSAPLIEETFFPVCAPVLVEAGPHPLREPADLAHHTLLHWEDDVAIPDLVGWPQWLAAAGVHGVDPRRGPRFTHTFLALQAAAGGQGVAIATSVLIGNDLASGRLVRPFGPDVPSPYSYHLVCPPAAAELPKVQAFWRWIRGDTGADGSPA